MDSYSQQRRAVIANPPSQFPLDSNLLFEAVKSYDTELIQFLIAHNHPLDQPIPYNGETSSPLHMAIMTNSILNIRTLVEAGHSISLRVGQREYNPLEQAILSQNLQAIEFLIERGMSAKDVRGSLLVYEIFSKYASLN